MRVEDKEKGRKTLKEDRWKDGEKTSNPGLQHCCVRVGRGLQTPANHSSPHEGRTNPPPPFSLLKHNLCYTTSTHVASKRLSFHFTTYVHGHGATDRPTD